MVLAFQNTTTDLYEPTRWTRSSCDSVGISCAFVTLLVRFFVRLFLFLNDVLRNEIAFFPPSFSSQLVQLTGISRSTGILIHYYVMESCLFFRLDSLECDVKRESSRA